MDQPASRGRDGGDHADKGTVMLCDTSGWLLLRSLFRCGRLERTAAKPALRLETVRP